MIWLIGDKGMLGSELTELLTSKGLSWVGSDRDVDIADPAALGAFASGKDIAWIVNCAAYTAVDRAEDEGDQCERLNALGPANIGAVAAEIGATLIHISTDYVFDGTGNRPYREDDRLNPIGMYGKTKAAGEAALRAACPRSYIVRTSWLYGKYGPNFVHTMLGLMRQRDKVGVVADQRGTPTYAGDLAEFILVVIESGKSEFGVYHYSGSGETNWQAFALSIFAEARETGLIERDCAIEALTTAQYPTKAHRPAYSVLSKAKIERVFGIVPPAWELSLKEYIAEISTIVRRQRKWFASADYDIMSAELDVAHGRYRAASFWCQQAVEKTLKGLMEFYERSLPTHDVLKIASRLRLPVDDSYGAMLKRLVKLYTDSRYGIYFSNEQYEIPESEGREIWASSKELLRWIRTFNRSPLE